MLSTTERGTKLKSRDASLTNLRMSHGTTAEKLPSLKASKFETPYFKPTGSEGTMKPTDEDLNVTDV